MGCATKDLGGYWKNMMKGQPMPEAIKALIDQNPLPRASAAGNHKDRFIRDFDVKPNVILYHTHVVPMKQNSYNPKNDAMAEQTIKKG